MIPSFFWYAGEDLQARLAPAGLALRNRAQKRVQALHHAAQSLGTTTEAKLQAQRSHWEHDERRLPGLEGKAASPGRVIEQTVNAIEGFAQEREREEDWIARRKRARDRDSGRAR